MANNGDIWDESGHGSVPDFPCHEAVACRRRCELVVGLGDESIVDFRGHYRDDSGGFPGDCADHERQVRTVTVRFWIGNREDLYGVASAWVFASAKRLCGSFF